MRLAMSVLMLLVIASCSEAALPGSGNTGKFDPQAALLGVNFDPSTLDGNGTPDGHTNSGNGLLDVEEMALIAAVLNDESMDLSAKGGVAHGQVRAAWEQTIASAGKDLAPLLDRYPTAVHMTAGYLMIGTDESIDSISHMVTMFNAPLKSDYSAARTMAQWFGPDGDADGDGVSNRAEYAAAREASVSYRDAALDPQIHESGAVPMPATGTPLKTVGILLYPGFEVLDVFGPVEMWSYVPGLKLVHIAEKAGPVKSTQGTVVNAEYGFDDAPDIDILLVPGGVGTITELDNPRMIEFIRSVHAGTELTTSVCTGSALLAKAGVLDGLRATSNKRFFSMAAKQSDKVNWVVAARWVEDGKVFTSSGVSAGTDMALAVVARLQGADAARQLASSVEYEWHDKADDDPFARYSDWPAAATAK